MLYTRHEKAAELVARSDPFTVRVCAVLQDRILQHCDTQPVAAFDVYFYFCSVVEYLAMQLGKPTRLLDKSHAVLAINVPLLAEESWTTFAIVQNGFARGYIDWLVAASDPSGFPFDVDFATRVFAEAFDESAISMVSSAGVSLESDIQDFDQWLQGFSR